MAGGAAAFRAMQPSHMSTTTTARMLEILPTDRQFTCREVPPPIGGVAHHRSLGGFEFVPDFLRLARCPPGAVEQPPGFHGGVAILARQELGRYLNSQPRTLGNVADAEVIRFPFDCFHSVTSFNFSEETMDTHFIRGS